MRAATPRDPVAPIVAAVPDDGDTIAAATRTTSNAVRLVFAPPVVIGELAGTLELALLAVESLHGADRVRLDAAWAVDPATMSVTIDAGSRSGHALALLFLGFCRREFGDAAVRVHRPTVAAQTPEGGQ